MSDALDFTERPTVLVVDDTPENLQLMSALLKDDYKVKVANNGERALAIAAGDAKPDLVLLDIMMPGIDGYEVCRRLKEDAATRDIPVIFLTAKTEVEDEERGFGLGAVDYVTKPVSPPIVLARVKTHLALKTAADFLKDKASYLEAEVARRTEQVNAFQDATVVAMAGLAESRDGDTGGHLLRTQNYVKTLAIQLRRHPRFAPALAGDRADILFKAAPLHDIGKFSLPDAVLMKTGPYTPQEFEIMTTHASAGRDAIAAAEARLPMPSPILACAREIAHSHHEKWDGSGYPQGLKGDDIPVAARLMAIADAYDALTQRRAYREPVAHEDAVAAIRAARGTHFDPDACDAFAEIADVFYSIAVRYADSSDALRAAAQAGATPLT